MTASEGVGQLSQSCLTMKSNITGSVDRHLLRLALCDTLHTTNHSWINAGVANEQMCQDRQADALHKATATHKHSHTQRQGSWSTSLAGMYAAWQPGCHCPLAQQTWWACASPPRAAHWHWRQSHHPWPLCHCYLGPPRLQKTEPLHEAKTKP
jgi:hypothetical protein